MKSPLIPRPVMIICGLAVLALTITVGVKLVQFLIDIANYGFAYSQLTETIQETAYIVVGAAQCGAGLAATLAFIVPAWGRKLFKTGYAISDEEAVLKAYRGGGAMLIFTAVLAIAVYAWILVSHDFYSHDILLPAGLLVCGIIGVIAGIGRKT